MAAHSLSMAAGSMPCSYLQASRHLPVLPPSRACKQWSSGSTTNQRSWPMPTVRARCKHMQNGGRSALSCHASSQAPNWKALQAKFSSSQRVAEGSQMVRDETILLIFQLQLDAQVQIAQNLQLYERAREYRQKREDVNRELRGLVERKAAASGNEEQSAKLTVADLATAGLQLRARLQKAIADERYDEAAKVRDMITELERQSVRTQALMDDTATAGPVLRLGQRVVHRVTGYRGVVIGWDPVCCETEEWMQRAGTSKLSRGIKQPFYHLLVHVDDWAPDGIQPPMAYVAEERLWAPEQHGDGGSWLDTYGDERFMHGWDDVLFLGRDARGDLVPTRLMRTKFNVARRDVYAAGEEVTEEEEESSDEDGDDSGGQDRPMGGGGKGPIIPGIDMSSLE